MMMMIINDDDACDEKPALHAAATLPCGGWADPSLPLLLLSQCSADNHSCDDGEDNDDDGGGGDYVDGDDGGGDNVDGGDDCV